MLRFKEIYHTNAMLVEHVHKFMPQDLTSYGMITPTKHYLFARFKCNLWANYLYASMDVESYPSPEHHAGDPLNLYDRHRLMLRHLERVNNKLVYTEPGTRQNAEVLAERALLSYQAGQDWWCLYNVLLFKYNGYLSDELLQQASFLYSVAYERGKGETHPPLEYAGRLLSCYTKAFVTKSCLYGRHLRANRYLSRGELVSRELPFIRLLTTDNLLRCDHCLDYKPYVLTPCTKCSLVMYCTSKCNMRAFEEYHAMECTSLAILRTHYTSLEHLAIRLTIRAIQLFAGKLDLLLETITQWSGNEQGIAGYGNPQGYHTDQRQAYFEIFNLCTNRNRMGRRDLLCDAAKAIGIAKMLGPEVQRVYGLYPLNDLNVQNALATLVVHHLQIARVNALYLSRSSDNPEQISTARSGTKPFAAVLMASGSIFNHSCVGNVNYSLGLGGTVQFVANTDIRKNRQLFINYGVTHTWPRYRFKCTCPKCVAINELQLAHPE